MSKSPLAVALAVAIVVIGAPAHANEQSDLEKARAAYIAHQYVEADARFRAMLDPRSGTLHDPALVTQARMVWGAVKVGQGRPDEAMAIFERLLLTDPGFDPDPLSFPTEVIDLFIDTRAKIRDKINAAAQAAAQAEAARKAREEEERRRERVRVAMLEQMASEERNTERHSRLVAFVPFGAGQFQNGQPGLGWFFLLTEASLVAAGAVTVPIYLIDLQSRSDAFRAGDRTRAQEYIERADAVRTVNLALFGTFVGTAAIGILQANLSFVPESFELHKRPIPPPSPTLTPTIAPSATGLTLGLTARF
jgi:hypothetical protein